jgi:putative endonuclease
MIGMLYRVADRLRDRARRRSLPVEAVNGQRGEDLVHRYLRRQGFTVVARNYRPAAGGGEIDLIGWQQDRLVFVEVKTRDSEEFGAPEAAVDPEKREFIGRAARDYARRAGVAWEKVRFDIASVILGSPPRVELRKDAFHCRRTL